MMRLKYLFRGLFATLMDGTVWCPRMTRGMRSDRRSIITLT